ncbi:MAG TPA: TolC family protein [candidate division Zixibacteria bacterium]|nr:TolC family protein [candidate division Zixibacteria bacterium]
MSWKRNAGWLSVLLIFLSGCATVALNAGFDEVSVAVAERGAGKIVWNSGTDLDKEAAEKVSSLLKGGLTADEAVQIALLNNRDLQAIYSDLGIAQADLVQAGLFQNPVFDAAVLFPVSGGRPDLDLSVVMNFLDVFYVPLRKRVATARFEETKLKVAGAVLDFARQVRTAFYLHQANEQMLELRRTVVQTLTASLELARRLHEAGNITDLDFARERALTEAARLELRTAEMAERQSREQLNALMGVWGKNTEWRTGGRLPDIPAQTTAGDDLERLALSRSLDLSIARQRIIAAGEQLGFNRATALIPEPTLGPLGEREEGWEAGPTVELSIPLFDRGQARIARALTELRRARQEYYGLAVRIRSVARAVQDRMSGSRDRALYYRDILVPLRERIVNEAQLQYNAMQLSPFELLRAKEQQIETAAAYIEALRDYWLARTDFAHILNGRLPGLDGGGARSEEGRMKMNGREAH